MNDYSEDFKGVWFPKDLWLDEKISLIEKGILVVIKNLDKSDEHCWATNNYLAAFFQCSVSTVKRAIAHLKELKYIEETEGGKVGVCRKLKVIIDIEKAPSSKGTQLKMNQVQNDLGGGSNGPGYPAQNDPLIIYNNNIYNNIRQTENLSNTDVLPTETENVKTELDNSKKGKRKTKKQQRYDEVMSSPEFNNLLHEGLSNTDDIKEIDTLWSEFIELRCSKDYRALTDGAVTRNLKVLKGTSPKERKTILEKTVTKGWTGLFPLNEYDKKRLEQSELSTEGSDERLVKQMFDTCCKEREDEVPSGTAHSLLMDLSSKYGDDKIKELYYSKVKPQVANRYSIKRDRAK